MPKPATEHTRRAHEEARRRAHVERDWDQDLEDASRGFIAPLPNDGVVIDDRGRVVFDANAWRFAKPGVDAPDTVHPSLWRQMQLLGRTGLFEVTERIYQVRGIDASNLTIIEGDTGLIVVDPLTCVETAKVAFDLYRQHRGDRPMHTVVSTHSHADHFGGIAGIVDPGDVAAGSVQVIVPEHFVEEFLSENVLAGNVMARRAGYMFGFLVPYHPQSAVGVGLCQTVPTGTPSFIPPTREITKPGGEELVIDGLTFVFQLAPNTEAPAEMHFFVRELRALTAAENANHTMHNVQTPRGAKPRDAASWARALSESVDLFVDDADVLFFMHTWPIWGSDRIRDFLQSQHDMYKYLHDQSLHLANQGLVPTEIANEIGFPAAIDDRWFNRGYYGSISHNSKAVYDRYLGWFDGNAANLNRYPPTEAGRRFVEMMGGADAVVTSAREYFERGDYQWSVEMLNNVIFAEPDHAEGRALLADAYEQLGYQSENGVWRNFYVTSAAELRGELSTPSATTINMGTLTAMPLAAVFDLLAIRLDGPQASTRDVRLRLRIADEGHFTVEIRSGVLTHRLVAETDAGAGPDTDAIVTFDRGGLFMVGFGGRPSVSQLIESDTITVEGDVSAVEHFAGSLVRFERGFGIAAR